MEFCSSLLGCKISADKPCRDGFPITNLIAGTKKEFIGESFVRPYCNIDLVLPVPVDIAYIKLQTQVRERRVTGLKIFMKTSSDSGEYCIGKCFSLTRNRILLKNYGYRHWLPFDLPKEQDDQPEDTHVDVLKDSYSKKFANNVQSLRIVLTSVSPTGPPVLKSIQVWGQPSSTCSVSQKNNIFKLWASLQKQSLAHANRLLPVNKVENAEEKKGEKRRLPEDGDVPEDFLDPITCEVMRLPILLPSGNSIDSFTLEKFLSNEAIWGRLPSDPFTGLPFRSGYKPEANVHLKARIDRFFLIEKHYDSSSLNALGHTLMNIYSDNKPETTSESEIREVDPLVSENISEEPTVNNGSLDLKPSLSQSQRAHINVPHSKPRQKDPPSGPSCPGNSSGYSFVQSIGTALSSVRKRGSYVQLKVTPTLNDIGNSSTPVTSITTVKTAHLPSSSIVSEKDKYSLAGMALSSLQCVCGSHAGLFYALKCKHNLCNKCIKEQLKRSEAKNFVRCEQCGDTSSTQQVIRIHPKSAFAS